MLRPSTLTALGVPSGTSLRSATFMKLDCGFDILECSVSICHWSINRRNARKDLWGAQACLRLALRQLAAAKSPEATKLRRAVPAVPRASSRRQDDEHAPTRSTSTLTCT